MQTELQRLISVGDVSAARELLVCAVRDDPDSPWARWLLFEIYLVCGTWERALAHLTTLRALDPSRLPTYEAYFQVTEALLVREAVWRGEQAPKCQDQSWLVWERRMELIRKAHAGDEMAARSLAELATSSPPVQGRCDAAPFDGWEDWDGRFRFGLEVIIDGEYCWLQWTEIRRFDLAGTGQRLRDLVVRPVMLTLLGQHPRPAFLPVRYPGTDESNDAALLLGKETRMRGSHGSARGVGTHLFRAGPSPARELPLTGFKTIEFAAPPTA